MTSGRFRTVDRGTRVCRHNSLRITLRMPWEDMACAKMKLLSLMYNEHVNLLPGRIPYLFSRSLPHKHRYVKGITKYSITA